MQQNLIKNSVDIDLDTPILEDLIELNIILEIKMPMDKTILESITMSFSKNINVGEMIKQIIPNFNESLENNGKRIYLNPDSNEYQLCECIESYEGGINKYDNGNILEKRTKIQNIQTKNLKILYSSKDILLNFERKKKFCQNRCTII